MEDSMSAQKLSNPDAPESPEEEPVEQVPAEQKRSEPIQVEYKRTPYRWVTLFGHMLSIMSMTMAGTTLQPVAIEVKEAYKLSSITVVNLAGISFSASMATLIFLAMWAFSRFSSTKVLRIASLVILVGTLVRVLIIPTGNFYFFLIGTVIISTSLPFFISSILLVVNRWFPD